nr:NVEALA domain-containing protein [uncultured Bacteroides sp.]
MKKIFFGTVVVVAIAVGTMINVNFNKTSNMKDLVMANVEALADPEQDEGVSDCDIFIYNRNAKEDYKDSRFTGKAGADGYVVFAGRKFGPFGAGAEVSFTYKSGYCPSSKGNCCLKSHVGKVRLL